MSRTSTGFAALGLLAVAACGQTSHEADIVNERQEMDGAVDTQDPTNVVTPDRQGAVRLPTYKASSISAAARLVGTLDRVGDCLVVTVGAGPEGFVPLWPEGRVRWDESSATLMLNDRSYKLGSKVDFAGGSLSRNATSPQITGERPVDCPSFNFWMVPLDG